MDKLTLRQQLLAERMALSAEWICAASREAQRMLIDSDEFAAARVIALYAPIRNEVDTFDAFAAARASGKTVLFPVVAGAELLFREVSEEGDLAAGAYGIREPAAYCRVVHPREAELIVVPGLVFDRHGRRVGYGKGYYDRALHQLEASGRLAGLCYEFQLVDQIVAAPHDVVMDMMITERQVVHFSGSGGSAVMPDC